MQRRRRTHGTAPDLFALNFFASVKHCRALSPLLKKKQGNCVVTSSNSITNMTVRMDWVDMLSNVMDEERVLEFVKDIPRTQAASCYSSSKHALARWVRRVSPSWAVDGLRINSVAPATPLRPMTQNMTDAQMDAALLIPIPPAMDARNSLTRKRLPTASPSWLPHGQRHQRGHSVRGRRHRCPAPVERFK